MTRFFPRQTAGNGSQASQSRLGPSFVAVLAVLACSPAETQRWQRPFAEASNAEHSLVAFVVSDENDCAGAVLAADMLRWPSVRRILSMGAVLTWGSSESGLRDASAAAAALGSSARRPSGAEQRMLDAVAHDGRAMLVVVDRRSRLRLVTSLSHNLPEKRAIVAWLHTIQGNSQ